MDSRDVVTSSIMIQFSGRKFVCINTYFLNQVYRNARTTGFHVYWFLVHDMGKPIFSHHYANHHCGARSCQMSSILAKSWRDCRIWKALRNMCQRWQQCWKFCLQVTSFFKVPILYQELYDNSVSSSQSFILFLLQRFRSPRNGHKWNTTHNTNGISLMAWSWSSGEQWRICWFRGKSENMSTRILSLPHCCALLSR